MYTVSLFLALGSNLCFNVSDGNFNTRTDLVDASTCGLARGAAIQGEFHIILPPPKKKKKKNKNKKNKGKKNKMKVSQTTKNVAVHRFLLKVYPRGKKFWCNGLHCP